MDLWRAYDYLVNIINKFMIDKDQCLYNAIVLCNNELSNDELLAIRDSLREIANMLEEDVLERQKHESESAEYEN